MLIIKQLKISKNDNFKRSAIYLVQRPCLLEISNTNYSVDSTMHKYTSINKFSQSMQIYAYNDSHFFSCSKEFFFTQEIQPLT